MPLDIIICSAQDKFESKLITMGLFICEPKFPARPEYLAPRQNFGLEFWPGKNEPKILAWNSRPEFQAKISGQNSRPKNLSNFVLLALKTLQSFKFNLKTCKIQTSHDILAWNFLAWNFGLKFWPEILAWKKSSQKFRPEKQARIPGQKFRPEKQFRLVDE